MKLFEIVNTQQDAKINIPYNDDDAIGRPSAYASVYNDPDDSHMALKRTKSNDPYVKYLKWLNDNEDSMSSNPYFPRVYKQSASNGETVDLQMEKLREFDTLNSKELEVATKRMVGKTPRELIDAYLEDYQAMDDFNSIKRRIEQQPHRAVGDYIKKTAARGEFSKFKDPQFRQAVKAIYAIHKDSPGTMVDMHAGNLMIRRGPYGPQVVVIDPLA